MSGARRHCPDVRVETAMDVLSCRITGRKIRGSMTKHFSRVLLLLLVCRAGAASFSASIFFLCQGIHITLCPVWTQLVD